MNIYLNMNEVFDLFTEKVRNGEYERIPYKDWRRLKEKFEHKIAVPNLRNASLIHLCVNSGENEYITTNSSFGKFLFETYFENTKTVTTKAEDFKYTNITKENDKMANKMFNFDFGPVSSSQFALSPYGLAISTKENGWVAYDGENLIDVDILNFKLDKMIYKMPATLDSIKAGDIVYHSSRPMFVKSVNSEEGTLRAVDYSNGSVVDVLPVKSPFGFNFITKVTSLIDLSVLTGSADAANPFGSMLPFLMLGNDVDPMMFALMSMNGINGLGDMTKNPMMMYLLMQNRGSNDALPFVLMTMAQTKAQG